MTEDPFVIEAEEIARPHHAAVILEMEVPPGWMKSPAYAEFLEGIERLMGARITDGLDGSGPGGAVLVSLQSRVEAQNAFKPAFDAIRRTYRAGEEDPISIAEFRELVRVKGPAVAKQEVLNRYEEIVGPVEIPFKGRK